MVPATLDEQSNIRSRQQIVSLLQRFGFVRQCIKCSAKNLQKVQEVVQKAQQAVLFPFSPLFDIATGTLTKDCQKALTRIFRMFDIDHDGLLSNAELDAFQHYTFRVTVSDRVLQGWKKVVSRTNTSQQAVVQDGKFTVAGFLAIFDVFVSQNHLDVPWLVLRKFGYSNDLDLAIPPQKTKSSKLTKSDCQFLEALFHQFDSEGAGSLSGENLAEIFSIVPGPSLPPWHPVRAEKLLTGCFSVPIFGRDGAGCSGSTGEELSVSASGITIASAASLPTVVGAGNADWNIPSSPLLAPMSFYQWMGHWHMLANISPAAARAELFRLGHASPASEGAPPRTKRKKAPPSVPSAELVVYVLGSQGCGKSSLLHLLGDWLLDPKETEPTMRPETSTAHKIVRRRPKDNKEEKEDIVVHYIFTEVPCDADRKQLANLLKHNRPSLAVFCFDSEKSLLDAMEIETELLDDDVARVFVVVAKGDKTGSADIEVVARATAHCHDLDLEAPITINTFDATPFDRDAILTHLARCGLDVKTGLESLKSRPHAEQKKREAMRRRKMIWLGGLVSVSVAVAVGVGLLWGSGKARKATNRFGWLAELIFGSARHDSGTTTSETTTAAGDS